jgi:uroporphyrinogen decarboxylase
VFTALEGGEVDRPPISFWGHFYDRESSARDLVEATLDFQARYGWDWIKLNPRKHYHVEPWGVRYRYSGATKPALESWPIHEPADWSKIKEVAHDQGALGEQIEAVHLLRLNAPAGIPIIQTVFTPLAILGEMTESPADLRRHMDSHPREVRRALDAVTATFERYVKAVLASGADGIYFATVDWASQEWITAEEYRKWSLPHDRQILAVASGAPFNVLHVCKRRNLLLELAHLPVRALSWDATDPTNPTIPQVLAKTRIAVMGGISHDRALLEPSPDVALSEFRNALEQTGGRRWLAAPSCSISPTTPPSNLEALRAAVEGVPIRRTH